MKKFLKVGPWKVGSLVYLRDYGNTGIYHIVDIVKCSWSRDKILLLKDDRGYETTIYCGPRGGGVGDYLEKVVPPPLESFL